MNVQDFIKENGVAALSEQLGITVKEYENGYVKLNYSQIDSPKNHSVADECRGLVLLVDKSTLTSKVIARSFSRFYNYGECDTKSFDFSNCTVYEKADGSLVMLYWSPLDQQWVIGTRGMAYAEGNFTFSLTESGGTFKDWILRAMKLTLEELQEKMRTFPKNLTYVFEYIGPENRVVCPYTESMVVLLAIINNLTGKEEPLQSLFGVLSTFMNVRLPVTYPAASGEELVKLAESLDGLKEGFVVYDNNSGKRVKIKSATYCAVHHLRGEGTPSQSRLIDVVLKNEQDELIAYFPEFKQFIEPIEHALAVLLNRAEDIYAAHRHYESQKDFALAVKDTVVAPICFKARKEGTTVVRAFETMELNQQSKLLEKFL